VCAKAKQKMQPDITSHEQRVASGMRIRRK
jgi:hypothetical protein